MGTEKNFADAEEQAVKGSRAAGRERSQMRGVCSSLHRLIAVFARLRGRFYGYGGSQRHLNPLVHREASAERETVMFQARSMQERASALISQREYEAALPQKRAPYRPSPLIIRSAHRSSDEPSLRSHAWERTDPGRGFEDTQLPKW
ncbi:hypothetical protein MRY87_09940 [bacterium]|nr:hypothetical protein [bacterium]